MPDRSVPPFVDTVATLADAHGLDVRISDERLAGHGAHVVVRRHHAEVSVSMALLAQPATVQEFVAAHEIAHVVLRHLFWRRIFPAVAWAVTVVVAVLCGSWLTVHHPGRSGSLTVVLLAALGTVASGFGAWAVLARRSRRCEDDADRLALAWGYRLPDPQYAPTHEENWLTTSRLYRPFRMHPLPHDRAGSSGSQRPAANNNHRHRPDPP